MIDTSIKKTAIVAAMAIGSIVMWIVNPVAWIYGVSKMADSTQVTMGQIVLIMVGVPGTMVVCGKGLGRLNRLYGEVTGTTPTMKVVAPWHKSMRGERDHSQPRTVLDVVMVTSVVFALGLMGIWFLFFAKGGGLPN